MIAIRPHVLLLAASLGIVAALTALANELPAARDQGRYRVAAQTYREANTAGKQRMIEHLLARSNAAASVTSSGADLQRVQDRNREILDRVAQGRELSDGGLLQLLAEVDSREQLAIAKLRRDFAYSTAQAFHDNRAEFDKWHDAWDRIEQRYQRDGRPLDWQQRMIDWLALASARQAQISIAQISIAQLRPSKSSPSVVPRPILPRRGPNIQQTELEARIAGYNLAVSRVFAELHEQKHWTVEELGRAAGELNDLTTTRHDLNLYWELLPAEAKAEATPLRPLDEVISLLAARTAQRRRELERTAANSPRDAWELRRLDEVSRRLATLAAPRG
jgi:hypothetical protein